MENTIMRKWSLKHLLFIKKKRREDEDFVYHYDYNYTYKYDYKHKHTYRCDDKYIYPDSLPSDELKKND